MAMITDYETRKKVWENKKLLKYCYEGYYKLFNDNFSSVNGIKLELGSSLGNIKLSIPDIITSDVMKTPNIDRVINAEDLPFEKASISNIVLLDVFHHIKNPIKFLDEAYRVLSPGGRLLMIEPYPSLISSFFYKLFHDEPFLYDNDPFEYNYNAKESVNPWDSNQAIPYLVFYKHIDKFNTKYKSKFKAVKRDLISYLLYPLSGGFSGKQLIPFSLAPYIVKIERYLSIFKKIIAFRCFIILEKLPTEI